MITKSEFLLCVEECLSIRYEHDKDYDEEYELKYLIEELNTRIKSYLEDNLMEDNQYETI